MSNSVANIENYFIGTKLIALVLASLYIKSL